MRCTAVLLIALLIALAPPAFTAQEETYEVRLHRPAKVGTRATLTFSGELSQRVTDVVNGQRHKGELVRIGLKLTGIVETTRVDERGRETAIQCTVEEATVSSDGKEAEKLARGTVIRAEAGEKETTIRLEKGELSPIAKAALQFAFPLKKGAGSNDDQLYGTAERQKAGANWPINVELLAAELSRQGLGVKKEHVSGQVKLVSVEKVGDEPRLNLLIEVEVHGFTSPPPPGAPGFKGGPGSVKTKMSVVFPVDPAKPRRLEDVATSIFLLLGGPGGALRETDIRQTHEARYEPAPAP